MNKVVIAVRDAPKEVNNTETKSNRTEEAIGLALAMLTRLQPFLLHFMDDRENQKGGQAAWIPDPDEEDILYCADYSSDMEEFQYVPACPDGEEDILYCADDPYADEVMYDADVSGDTDGASLFSVADNWEGNSFSSCTSTIILDPKAPKPTPGARKEEAGHGRPPQNQTEVATDPQS
ncbi:hypothetical protein GHT06_003615 [Daphnia sinensis]|uniref:Uncharacterized protein n=1 Tax=Daphnia sinensis TaxID=1820382 RepID=A0AAD5KWF9_9CRUS|nr:hypothetical protein GHT06_003615 [Daphnia sinensis]